jgi:hypothetical protein
MISFLAERRVISMISLDFYFAESNEMERRE